MKLSKDYVTAFTEAAKAGEVEKMTAIFTALCGELGLEAETLSPDEAKAVSIAMLFNNRNTNQSSKKI